MFSVDQFMQVKCRFQLVSESDSPEAIHSNNERVRLCASCEPDRQSALIVLICSNETSNNHIIAYYTENRAAHAQQHSQEDSCELLSAADQVHSPSSPASANAKHMTFAQLVQSSPPIVRSNGWPLSTGGSGAAATGSPAKLAAAASAARPKTIIKQIYYHNYNEDIVSVALDTQATKLVLVSGSSTIYILPIRNILLNLHAQQLRSSQGKSMYFYDAAILDCCALADPVASCYWTKQDQAQQPVSFVIVANRRGKIHFISVQDKRELFKTSVDEPIKSMQIVRDRFSVSLLITCESFNQYRLALEMTKLHCTDQQQQHHHHHYSAAEVVQPPSSLSLPQYQNYSPRGNSSAPAGPPIVVDLKNPSWNKRPQLLRLAQQQQAAQASGSSVQSAAAAVFQRVFAPASIRLAAHQANVMPRLQARQRSQPLIFYNHSASLVSIVDVLGSNCHRPASTTDGGAGGGSKLNANQTLQSDSKMGSQKQRQHGSLGPVEPRLLRFYSSKQYAYKPQKPYLTCKLHLADPDETITHVVLTDRLVAVATDRDRCLINSRNCCNLKHNSAAASIELDPLVKEVVFGNEERIMLLIRSPSSNDQDNIIDSFLLITTRSIYSIQARQSCRDMFVNLIDTQLGIKGPSQAECCAPPALAGVGAHPEVGPDFEHVLGDLSLFKTNNFKPFDYCAAHRSAEAERQRKNSRSNLLIDSFLRRRDEIYERICYDSRAFSVLFKLELNSLYEAYGDRCLVRERFFLANRFFQMANFDHTRILGKYIRLGAYKETIDYVLNVLHDDNEILDEKERIDLSKAAFECLLAKTIVERSKISLFSVRSSSERLARVLARLSQVHEHKKSLLSPKSSPTRHQSFGFLVAPAPPSSEPNPIALCDHCPRVQESKLSAATLVVDPATPFSILSANTGTGAQQQQQVNEDEEATLTSTSNEAAANCDHRDDLPASSLACRRKATRPPPPPRMECEKNLIDFIRNSMPSSLYNYAMSQLIAFNLIELVSCMVSNDSQVHALLRILVRAKDDDQRIVFRDKRLSLLVDKLSAMNLRDLVEINLNKAEFLEFITSSETTRALVKDIGLTCEYLGYQHTHVQFRKYSFAALRHLETYLQLINTRRALLSDDEFARLQSNPSNDDTSTPAPASQSFHDDDENAHDGQMHFKLIRGAGAGGVSCQAGRQVLTKQEKSTFERIFIQFLNACLRESTEDSCRLWSSYIEFYTTNLGSLEELEGDILQLIDTNSGDLRLPLTLFKAIHRATAENVPAKQHHQHRQKPTATTTSTGSDSNKCNTIGQLRNMFLMKLLEKTLAYVPQSKDLDALIVMAMC